MTSKLCKELMGLGVDEEGALRIERLLNWKTTPYEKKKWKKLGILSKDDKLIVSSVEDDAFVIELVLFDLCWKGLVKRCSDEEDKDKD